LSAVALTQAYRPISVYIARNQAIKTPVTIQTSNERATRRALLDSGAIESFLHLQIIEELKLFTHNLDWPRKVCNVDRMDNWLGEVIKEVQMQVTHESHCQAHQFLVADIGEDDIILGYPFFKAANPMVDWPTGKVHGVLTLTEIQPMPVPDTHSPWVQWIIVSVKKTTVAQQLAEEATDKRERTWEELVPEQYHKFSSIFSEKDSERFPGPRKWDHAIDLKADAPISINCHIYPLSLKEKEEQKEFLTKNLWLKRICRSNSPYASSFFLIQKKDGKFHPVQDYRNLNKWMIPNCYPLPLINDLIYDLAGYWLFSKFDVRWGYNNIWIKKGDKWKAAFKTSEGLFKPTVMFFGLTNSPATFQTMMDNIFREEIVQGWLKIYMDDLIVALEDNEVIHQQWVDWVLQKIKDHDLFLKAKKCSFHKKQVEYLEVIIGQGKVEIDPVKVEGIVKWPIPATVKDVCSFLGFCNFYCSFIANFSAVAHPLNDFTKKQQQWSWTNKEQASFDTLKDLCSSYPVLRSPNWTKQFFMDTDTSDFTLRAVISQEFQDGKHLIAFHSRTLLPVEHNYDIHNKEMAAIVYGFKCRHPYFLGANHPIIIRTDHKNLQYFCQPQKITSCQARWMEFLQDFNFTLEHIPGHTNTVANLLSCRKDLNKGVDSQTCILLPLSLFLHRALHPNITHKIYLEDDPDKRREVLHELHSSSSVGHPGITNTWSLVSRHYEGPQLYMFIEQYIWGCPYCQESKTNIPQKWAPLQRFDTHVDQGPFQYVSMDLITDLPFSEGHNSILTIID
jgi:reverse transcriptase-like protein/integrase-like protein